jgi:hypothetical protein
MTEIRILAGLLVVSLVGAYLSWFSQDAPATRRVLLVAGDVRTLERLELTSDTATVALEMRVDDAGARFPWIEYERESASDDFVGGERVEEALERLVPLTAERSLGDDLAPETLEAMGLEPKPGRLALTVDGETQVFELGGRTGARGRGDYYLRRPGEDEVVLIAGRDLEAIERADRGRQRTIQSSEERDVARFTITDADGTVELLHQNRTDSDAFWALASTPASRSEPAARLVREVLRMSITDFPDPEPSPPAERTRFEWFGADDELLGWAEIGAREEKGRSTPLVKSPETHRWARMASAVGRRVLETARTLGESTPRPREADESGEGP